MLLLWFLDVGGRLDEDTASEHDSELHEKAESVLHRSLEDVVSARQHNELQRRLEECRAREQELSERLCELVRGNSELEGELDALRGREKALSSQLTELTQRKNELEAQQVKSGHCEANCGEVARSNADLEHRLAEALCREQQLICSREEMQQRLDELEQRCTHDEAQVALDCVDSRTLHETLLFSIFCF